MKIREIHRRLQQAHNAFALFSSKQVGRPSNESCPVLSPDTITSSLDVNEILKKTLDRKPSIHQRIILCCVPSAQVTSRFLFLKQLKYKTCFNIYFYDNTQHMIQAQNMLQCLFKIYRNIKYGQMSVQHRKTKLVKLTNT